MQGIYAVGLDGADVALPYETVQREGYTAISISKGTDFHTIRRVVVDPFDVIATVQDDGYILLPRGKGCNDYALCMFRKHTEDFDRAIRESNIPVFGIKTPKRCFLAVVSGMSYSYTLQVSLNDGAYRVYPIFEMDGLQPYEDIRIEYFELTGKEATYAGMARRYRQWKLQQGILTPLSVRMENNAALAYAAESVMVRVRCGWKPAPSPIRQQTLENEPPMHVACDFERVGDLLDALQMAGVDKAEICLVGWNVKGHDGRWPQTFPVCEELGGEEALRALIRKAQNMGYQITCHTNSTDQYQIADRYDANNTRVDRTGKPVRDGAWSGGEMWQLCPRIGYEQAAEILPQVAALGFHGMHYVDVLGVVHPRECYHPDHPVNYRESVEYAAQISALCKDLFGGFSSEGTYDFIAPYTDFGLYISFSQQEDILCDRRVPFWQLVYHGYVLSNPYPETVNPTFKSRAAQLKLIEYGGRPAYYFYSAFMDNGNNWMGAHDALCGTDEQMQTSVEKIRQGYEMYKTLSRLQTVYMEDHCETAENVYDTTYSDGTVIRVDYNTETYEILKERAPC